MDGRFGVSTFYYCLIGNFRDFVKDKNIQSQITGSYAIFGWHIKISLCFPLMVENTMLFQKEK